MIKKALFLCTQYLIPHRLLNYLMSGIGNTTFWPIKTFMIRFFMRRFKIDLSESEITQPKQFRNFNEFFTRKLKPGARNIASGSDHLVSPVDGIIFDHGMVKNDQLLMAKDVSYSAYQILGGSNAISERFIEGQYMSFYLSPKHYHRVHMPVRGTLKEMFYIPGNFYSVSNKAVEYIPELYTKNERLVVFFETDKGLMAVIFIGAMIVGSIHTVWQGQVNPDYFEPKVHQWKYPNPRTEALTFEAGDEIGHFQMGSSVILMWDHRAYALLENIHRQDDLKYGQAIAEIT